MNITVYRGANQGNDPALGRAVEELGRWIGESGHRLIYGGSKSGLMGVLADCVERSSAWSRSSLWSGRCSTPA